VGEFTEWIRARDYDDGQIQFQQTVPACSAETQPCKLSTGISTRLIDSGIDKLYAHQVAAVDAVRRDQNVVLATPTA